MDDLETRVLAVAAAVVGLKSRLFQLYGGSFGEVKPQVEILETALAQLLWKEPDAAVEESPPTSHQPEVV